MLLEPHWEGGSSAGLHQVGRSMAMADMAMAEGAHSLAVEEASVVDAAIDPSFPWHGSEDQHFLLLELC